MDFDVDGPAGNLAAGSDGGTSSDGSSDGCHAVIETEVRAWLIWSLTGPDKLTTKVRKKQHGVLVSAKRAKPYFMALPRNRR